MGKRWMAVTAAVGLCVAFSCVAAVAQERPIVGGYKEAKKDDPAVVAAAEFAVGARQEQAGGPLSLVSIMSAERQVVQGMNYRLCLEVKAGEETDAGVESQSVQAVVYQNLKREYSLTSWEEKHCGGEHSEESHASSAGTREPAANEEARRAADASADKPCLAAPAQNHLNHSRIKKGKNEDH